MFLGTISFADIDRLEEMFAVMQSDGSWKIPDWLICLRQWRTEHACQRP